MSKLYAGDLSPKEAWETLKSDPSSILIDVRTTAELHFVGEPDLSSLGKQNNNIEFLILPTMEQNPNFENLLSSLVQGNKNSKILFLSING